MTNYKKLIKTNQRVQSELLRAVSPEAMTIKELAIWGNMLAKNLAVVNRQLDNESLLSTADKDYWQGIKGAILAQLLSVTDAVDNYQSAAAEGDEDSYLTVTEITKLFELAGVCSAIWEDEQQRELTKTSTSEKQMAIPDGLDTSALEKLMGHPRFL